MATARLMSPDGTQTGAFIATVALDVRVTDVDKPDFNLRAITENGIAGVDFTIANPEPNDRFNLAFTLPADREGSFELSMTGMVTREGGSSPEAVTSNTLRIVYDTTANVAATFGTPDYQENGVIVVPITFAEPVIASKTVFQVSGDALAGIEYYLLGEGTDFELVFSVPLDRSGSFMISADGNVLKVSTGIFDNVVAAPVTVTYDTTVPEVKRYDIPATYIPGEKFDVVLELNTSATVSPAPTGGTFLDHFIFEGADLGTPNLYRKTDETYPNLPIANDLGTDWTQEDMTTAEATIYLLRWNTVVGNPQGAFNLTVRPGAFRGPVD